MGVNMKALLFLMIAR